MIALLIHCFVYVPLAYTAYRAAFSVSDSRGLGLVAAVGSVVLAAVFLERAFKSYGQARSLK